MPNQPTPNVHVIVGLTILALVGWRLWLRWRRGVPALPGREHPYLRAIAAATHGLFYLLLIVLPLTGALAWFGSVNLAATSHALIEKLLLVVIALHVGGALVQHFWYKSDVLRRMLGLA